MIGEEPDGNKLKIISQIFGRFEKKAYFCIPTTISYMVMKPKLYLICFFIAICLQTVNAQQTDIDRLYNTIDSLIEELPTEVRLGFQRVVGRHTGFHPVRIIPVMSAYCGKDMRISQRGSSASMI